MLLTWFDVLPIAETARVGNDALAREHVVSAGSAAKRFARGHAYGANAIGVSERDDPETSEHGDTCVRALALLHKAADRGEDILLVDTELARLLQVVGKDVQQELRVGGRVDVPMSGGIHGLEQRLSVNKVPILIQYE